MDKKELNKVIARRVKHIHESLELKSGEYAHKGDRLSNFKVVANMLGCTKQQAWRGMMAKHLASIFMQIETGNAPSREFIDEKIGDAINYLILLDALWSEK